RGRRSGDDLWRRPRRVRVRSRTDKATRPGPRTAPTGPRVPRLGRRRGRSLLADHRLAHPGRPCAPRVRPADPDRGIALLHDRPAAEEPPRAPQDRGPAGIRPPAVRRDLPGPPESGIGPRPDPRGP